MTRTKPFRLAEFFAGIGLVRAAAEPEGFEVIFANDIAPDKHTMYVANFGATHFVLDDVRNIRGDQIPDIDLATASFPCTDLSLAGNRAGLAGKESGMFWEFTRILHELGPRRPRLILLENVVGFVTSHGGKDLAHAIQRLNDLGYRCDLFTLDAKWFVPQSRVRLFVVGSLDSLPVAGWPNADLRPAWLRAFVDRHPNLLVQTLPLPPLEPSQATLKDYVQRLPPSDKRWWDKQRLEIFLTSLSPIQSQRLLRLQAQSELSWATAYRRTRNGRATWEIRTDAISGCLRTPRGGSSKQALVEAGDGRVRVRWMTAAEYARLQGAPNFKLGGVRESAALFGFGDAVCVPVIAWIAKVYLRPLLEGKLVHRLNTQRQNGVTQ